MTPPTQQITRGWVGCRGRDAVADGDAFGSNEDLLDEKAEHPLAFLDIGCLRFVLQSGEEALEVLGELEVGVAVDELCGERVELGAQTGFAGPQRRHPGTQFVQRQQLFLVGLDQPADRGGGLGQREIEAGALGGGRVGGAGLVRAAVEFGGDQRRVGEQPGDVGPHDLVEVRCRWIRWPVSRSSSRGGSSTGSGRIAARWRWI